jgi:hypothetical protein
MIVENLLEHGIRGRFLRSSKFFGGHEGRILAVSSQQTVRYYEFDKSNITIAARDASGKHRMHDGKMSRARQ